MAIQKNLYYFFIAEIPKSLWVQYIVDTGEKVSSNLAISLAKQEIVSIFSKSSFIQHRRFNMP